jgi:hypothetical protein
MADNDTPDVIDEKQIKSKDRIGTLDGEPVLLYKTHGGFNLVVGKKNGKNTTFGTGPHPGLAKFIAKKNAPGIVMLSMAKSEEDSIARNEVMVAKYEAITQRVALAFTNLE